MPRLWFSRRGLAAMGAASAAVLFSQLPTAASVTGTVTPLTFTGTVNEAPQVASAFGNVAPTDTGTSPTLTALQLPTADITAGLAPLNSAVFDWGVKTGDGVNTITAVDANLTYYAYNAGGEMIASGLLTREYTPNAQVFTREFSVTLPAGTNAVTWVASGSVQLSNATTQITNTPEFATFAVSDAS